MIKSYFPSLFSHSVEQSPLRKSRIPVFLGENVFLSLIVKSFDIGIAVK